VLPAVALSAVAGAHVNVAPPVAEEAVMEVLPPLQIIAEAGVAVTVPGELNTVKVRDAVHPAL